MQCLFIFSKYFIFSQSEFGTFSSIPLQRIYFLRFQPLFVSVRTLLNQPLQNDRPSPSKSGTSGPIIVKPTSVCLANSISLFLVTFINLNSAQLHQPFLIAWCNKYFLNFWAFTYFPAHCMFIDRRGRLLIHSFFQLHIHRLILN